MTWEGLNRRKFPRVKFPCLVKVVREGRAEDVLLTHTENISVGGFCVVIKKSLEIFSPVGVEIDLMDGEDVIVCRGRTVWSVRRKATEAVKPSHYDIGIEFAGLKEKDLARVEQVVDHFLRVQQKSKI